VTPLWVDDPAALDTVIDGLCSAEAYALDTEFHRERTYYAQLALLQLAWPGHIALVDPRAVDVAPLAKAFATDATCIMHAASQDLEILERACGSVPRLLFDTQVAAGFVGYASPGLGLLVHSELGITLPKADRLTDWMVRPLGAGVLEYAASDVAHLAEVRDLLCDKLRARDRLDWVLDECELVRVKHSTVTVAEHAWWRIKDARSLRGRAAAVAQAVGAWREQKAAELDRPVRFVLPDLGVIAMAQRPPKSGEDLKRIRGLDERHSRGAFGRELLAAVETGLALPADAVQLPPTDGVDRALRPAVTLVTAWISQLARDLEIDTALLATRADVEALLNRDLGGRLSQGWRAAVVGEPVRLLVEGEASLAFDGAGQLVLESRSRRAPT
jgi:ribonuclease D